MFSDSHGRAIGCVGRTACRDESVFIYLASAVRVHPATLHQRSDASFPQSGSDFTESFCAIGEACFTGAHGGAPLADFIQVSTLHSRVCFTHETGEEIFHHQSASGERQG